MPLAHYVGQYLDTAIRGFGKRKWLGRVTAARGNYLYISWEDGSETKTRSEKFVRESIAADQTNTSRLFQVSLRRQKEVDTSPPPLSVRAERARKRTEKQPPRKGKNVGESAPSRHAKAQRVQKTVSRKRGNASSSGSSGFCSKRFRTVPQQAQAGPAPKSLSAEAANKLGMKLWRACKTRQKAQVKSMIAKGASVNWQNRSGRAPLHVASEFANLKIVMLLIEMKANLNITDKKGETPLFSASRARKDDIAHELVWSLCDITIRNKEGQTAAEATKRPTIFRSIPEYLTSVALREQAEVRADPSRKDVLRKEYRARAQRDKNIWMLYDASREGRCSIVKRLIKAGTPGDIQLRCGKTAVHWAAESRSHEIIRVLVESNANINTVDQNGETPLFFAARNADCEVARELVWGLCDITIRNKEGKTAADVVKEHFMSWRNLEPYLRVEAPREQAEIRADPSRKEDLRQEEIQWQLGRELNLFCETSSSGRSTKLAEYVIARGAPVNWCKNRRGNVTPLHGASKHGNLNHVLLLIKSKANLNSASKWEKVTPLIQAARYNHLAVVRALVEAGAELTKSDTSGRTPACVALQRGHHTVFDYLVNVAPVIRFHPSTHDESGQLYNVQGRATRAIDRDIVQPGRLPTGPVSIIKEFAMTI